MQLSFSASLGKFVKDTTHSDRIENPEADMLLIEGAIKTLRYDQIVAFSAGALWTLLSFQDSKKAKKLVAGPGAAMGVMWGWREEFLAKRIPFEKNAKQF